MLDIRGVSQGVTAYKKYLDFEYQGKNYGVVLYWDEHEGYELWFKSESSTPEWAIEWDEELHGGSLEFILDDLSDNKLEEESK